MKRHFNKPIFFLLFVCSLFMLTAPYPAEAAIKKGTVVTGSSAGTAGKMNLNTYYSVDHTAYDSDWVSFDTLKENAFYTVKIILNTSNSENSLYETNVSLFDTNLKQLASTNIDPKNGTVITYTIYCEDSTTNFINFKRSTPSILGDWGDFNANFTVTVSYLKDTEANTIDEASAITLGKNTSGKIVASDDVDWFKVKTSSKGKYVLKGVNKGSMLCTSGTILISLYDQDYNLLGSFTVNTNSPGNKLFSLAGKTTYYIKVENDSNMYNTSYKISLAKKK